MTEQANRFLRHVLESLESTCFNERKVLESTRAGWEDDCPLPDSAHMEVLRTFWIRMSQSGHRGARNPAGAPQIQSFTSTRCVFAWILKAVLGDSVGEVIDFGQGLQMGYLLDWTSPATGQDRSPRDQ